MSNIEISSATGYYYKIGCLVYVSATITCKSSSTSGGRNEIGVLPFIPAKDAVLNVGYCSHTMVNTNYAKMDMSITAGYRTFNPVYWSGGRSWSGDNCLSLTSGVISFSGIYLTDE